VRVAAQGQEDDGRPERAGGGRDDPGKGGARGGVARPGRQRDVDD
jgi:hypothetical protein